MAFLGVHNSITGRKWNGPSDEQHRRAEAIAQTTGQKAPVASVLGRLAISPESVDAYLNPLIRNLLPDPRQLKDVSKAAQRLIKAVNDKEKVVIYADYDVDGATSGAMLVSWFRFFNIQPSIYVPDRIKEGYGPNERAMTSLSSKHDLIICVDCGTLGHEPLEFVSEGCEVVILDHHLGSELDPKCYSIVNPNRQIESGNLSYLCAAGVVFLTLVECGRQIKSQNKNTPNLMEYLDLVALGTVADVAPLIGVNRAFVRQGLKILSTRQRLGLQMLIDKSGLNSTPTSYHLGYILGPKLNAPGRIGPSDLAIKLLCSNSISEATNLCEEIEELNLKRKEIENNVREEALEKVDKNQAKNSIIWAAAEGWHPGVVGIVASRLKDKFNKPALVIGFDGIEGKGSGRSVDGYDLGFAIQRLQREGLIQKGGGHKMAAGLSLKKDQLQTAMHRLCELAEKDKIITPEAQEVPVDGILFIQAVKIDLIEELENCGPFGSAIREPRFAFCDVSISFSKRVGDTHLKVRFSDDNGKSMDAICFRAFEGSLGTALAEHGGKKVHLVGKLDINYWQGKKSPQLIIDDAAWPEKL
mgnify:FL=1